MREAPDFAFDAMGQVHLDRWSARPGGINGYAPASRLQIGPRTASMLWMTRWLLLAEQFAKAGNITLPDYGSAVVSSS